MTTKKEISEGIKQVMKDMHRSNAIELAKLYGFVSIGDNRIEVVFQKFDESAIEIGDNVLFYRVSIISNECSFTNAVFTIEVSDCFHDSNSYTLFGFKELINFLKKNIPTLDISRYVIY